LTDTTVHTSGSGKYGLKLIPISSSELFDSYSLVIPTGNIQNETKTVLVWVKIKNANYYAGTHTNPTLTVNYDDGTEVTAVATDTTDWQALMVNFTPSTTYGQITITVSGKTDATGTDREFVIDDFGGGFLVNGGFDLWADGLPVPPFWSFLMEASAFWESSSLADYGANSMGEKVKNTHVDTQAILNDLEEITTVVEDNQAFILGK